MDLRRNQETSFWVAEVAIYILTKHIPNTCLERYRYANPLSVSEEHPPLCSEWTL
jgi:hypothetical protein